MAQADKNTHPGLVQEILGVSGIFLALYLLLCLGSFSLDGSTNLGGRIGDILSVGLMTFLGASSFWLVLLLLFFAFNLFAPSLSFSRLPYVFIGTTGVLFASSGLFGVVKGEDLIIFGRKYPAGGYLGDFLSQTLGRYFGGAGVVLFFGAVLLVSLMISVRFSPYATGKQSVALCQWCLARLKKYLEFRAVAAANRTRLEQKNAAVRKPVTEPLASLRAEEDTFEASRTLPRVHQTIIPETKDDDDEDFHPVKVSYGEFRLPGLGLLDRPVANEVSIDQEHYFEVSRILESKLKDFGVNGKVVGISPGPIITTYEFAPAPGVKINKIVSLADDLALGLKAESVRIIGTVPGKAALGIEIPNPIRQIVPLRDILATEKFQQSQSRLTLALGMDVVGKPVTANLAKMPHLLIAGATGSGKSVGINTIICSILMKATPDEVRLLLVDPKRIELSLYENIPHLLHPVVVDPKMAARALQWAVREMERRYTLMEESRVKSLASFNEVSEEKLPLIVIIIDELADLMMVSSREVEDSVARLAQMARAAGMHLILATQRPSVDVLTGLIKANFPTRMSFKVSSKVDSRTILDGIGAEHLLGAGDMLFMPPGTSRLQRIHGAYISENEIERIVAFLKEQRRADHDETMLTLEVDAAEQDEASVDEYDEKYDEAVALVCESGQASISMVQRRLRVGYNRAARMIELMEKEGVVGPADGSKSREVLTRKSYS